jgi:hypothetical protein
MAFGSVRGFGNLIDWEERFVLGQPRRQLTTPVFGSVPIRAVGRARRDGGSTCETPSSAETEISAFSSAAGVAERRGSAECA